MPTNNPPMTNCLYDLLFIFVFMSMI
jgi:hypothetical protein